MKLINIIAIRISLIAVAILAFWSVLFYYAVMNEVNDEVDDALEDYAETILIRHVRNEELPTQSSGSNNQFFIKEISPEEAMLQERVRYEDRDVFINEKNEFEPARVLHYIFENEEGKLFELEVSTPHIEKRDLKQAIFYWIIFLFIAILLFVSILSIWSVKRTMSPLRVLLKWIDNYRVGADNKPLNNPTKIYELSTLNKVVEDSFGRMEEAYLLQKRFVENASHEMQTPLAISISRLEMMLEDPTLSEKQMESVVKTKQTLDRLVKMNRALLLLSKIDNGLFHNHSSVCISEIVQKLIPDYQMVYAAKNISLNTVIKEPFYLNIDENLAATLVSNLIKNAYTHNISGGEILISTDKNSIIVENTSDNGELDEKLIFERFYHSSNSRQSIGLGLSIVQSICRNYNLNIHYSFNNGKHRFTIKKN